MNGLWRYVGPGAGKGELHRVAICTATDIITISAAHAWQGSWPQFQKHFEKVEGVKA